MYQFERTVFGQVSAPSRANCTMRRNADENGGDLPLVSKPFTNITTYSLRQ